MPNQLRPYHGEQDDKVLLHLIASGDHAAFSLLYERYVRPLTRYGLRFTNDIQVVEDSLHDLFVWIWNKRGELEISYSLKSYLVKSVRTTILQKLNRQQKQVSFCNKEETSVFRPVGSAADHLADAEDQTLIKNQVAAVLDSLTSRQREVIYLRYYEGLPFPEIARNMNLSVKACYKLMGRAVNEFRKAWRPQVTYLIVMAVSTGPVFPGWIF